MHRCQSPLSPDVRNPADVPECLLRRQQRAFCDRIFCRHFGSLAENIQEVPLISFGTSDTPSARNGRLLPFLAQTVEKPLRGFSTVFCSLPRAKLLSNCHWQLLILIRCATHRTCSLRCVLCQVHALTQNGFRSSLPHRRQTLRGFFDTLSQKRKVPPVSGFIVCWCLLRPEQAGNQLKN